MLLWFKIDSTDQFQGFSPFMGESDADTFSNINRWTGDDDHQSSADIIIIMDIITMTSNTILPNSHFSVNYDFEEPEFDNITNEAKVSSLSLALNMLWSLSSASWLSSPSSSQRSSSSSRSGFHLLSSDSATSSASDCCGQLATWLAAGWWWSSWWSQWSWWSWSWQ